MNKIKFLQFCIYYLYIFHIVYDHKKKYTIIFHFQDILKNTSTSNH